MSANYQQQKAKRERDKVRATMRDHAARADRLAAHHAPRLLVDHERMQAHVLKLKLWGYTGDPSTLVMHG